LKDHSEENSKVSKTITTQSKTINPNVSVNSHDPQKFIRKENRVSNINNNSLNSTKDTNLNNNLDKPNQLKENTILKKSKSEYEDSSITTKTNTKNNQQTQEENFNGSR